MAGRDDAAQDLLFGLLALRAGLLDQIRLFLALDAWTHADGRPMAEILAGLGAIDEHKRKFLEGLVAQYLRQAAAMPPGEIGTDDSESDRPVPPGRPDLSATVAYVGSQSAEGRDHSDRAADHGIGATKASAASPEGRFRIIRHHARGGLGEVFVALDPELDRLVALKELQPYHAHDPLSQSRFLLEAKLTGRLEHPGIVPVYGLGRYADGRPYYAMRFIEGETLKRAIERFHGSEKKGRDPGEREIAFRRLLRSLIEACNAVAYAHSRGVVHRDLKPENIMLGRFGETLVVDWGIAKPLAEPAGEPVATDRTPLVGLAGDSSLTRPGSALGTPQYMSPEQAAGAQDGVGPASDVYSLGATLYCLLVGHGPFPTGDVADVLGRVRRGIFPSPRRLRRSVDPELEALCLKAMSLEKDGRHATPLALAEEIEAWLANVRYRGEHERALNDVQRSLVRLCIERAHHLFGRDRHGDGMLWLARALENVPADAPGIEQIVRASLAGWHSAMKLLERGLSHIGGVHVVAFSPDGRRLATVCADGSARLWDLSTGTSLLAPMAHDGEVPAIQFSPDGRHVATVCLDGTLRRWDAMSGDRVGEPMRHEVRANAACFSPDGRLLATSGDDGTVWLRDAATGDSVGEPIRHEAAVTALAISSDARSLLSGCLDGRARLWDVARRTLTAEFIHRSEIAPVAVSPSGGTVATACDDGTARLWDSATTKPIGEPLAHPARVDCLTFNHGGNLVGTGSRDGTGRLWDAATGLPIGPPLEHRGPVRALAFSPDGGRLATASADGMARSWRIPAPVAGDAQRIACWVRAVNERDFDEGDAIGPLDPLALWDLRHRLQEMGGPPMK